MKSPIRAFFTGIAVFVAGTIVVLILSLAHLGDVLGASPTHKPGDGKLVNAASGIWFSGTYLTRMLLDRIVFGGPMPPEGSKINSRATAKEWQIYHHERERRSFAYSLSWLASPLLFGLLFAFYARLKNKKAERAGPANPCPSGTSVTEAACAPSAPEASRDT